MWLKLFLTSAITFKDPSCGPHDKVSQFSMFVLPQELVLSVASSKKNTSSVLNINRVAESSKNCFVPQMFNDPKLITLTFSEFDFTVGWN